MSDPIIICQNLCKTYGTGESLCHALQGVDLTVYPGELRLLMGPSGSGKTTLISIIAAILDPTEGSCLVQGIDLNHLSDREKTHYRGKHIGFVFQAFNLIPSLSNEENIAIPLLIQGHPKQGALQKAKSLLDELGLKEKIGRFPNELSGGQQQRVAIARGIVHDPSLIVCDEPTSFLDHQTGARIMEILRNIVSQKNSTLLVVTHDPRIVSFADRIDYLEDGRITQSKNPVLIKDAKY